LILCAASAGCHTHKHIRIPDVSVSSAPSIALRDGDDVRIILRNGDEVRFVVTEVQADALVGSTGRRILYRDMQSLEKRQLSKVKTGVMLGVLGWVALVMIAGAITGGGLGY
jgi:hypothetical protein